MAMRCLGMVLLLLGATPGMADEATMPRLTCTLAAPAEVPTGQPVRLRIAIHNGGTRALEILRWNTPWEGRWAAPFVAVSRDGVALAYGGRMVKRGRPQAEDWFTLDAGGTLTGEVDLSSVYIMTTAGSYQIAPHLRLHDVRTVGRGRRTTAEAAAPRPLDCPMAIIRIVPSAATTP